MPINKKQIMRMAKFVSELRQNRFPNASSFADRLASESDSGFTAMKCTTKTIQRDIKSLKEDFGAPIEWNSAKNGYYFRHQGWEFQCPILEDADVVASILGARVAEAIFPEPVKGRIRESVDMQLTCNAPDFLDEAYIETLIIGSGCKVNIKPEVFKTVFDAWHEHNCIEIDYLAPGKDGSTRRIEPHILTFVNNAWYIKGVDREKDGTRLFAVHRIERAEDLGFTFEPDPQILKDVAANGAFTFEQVNNVVIQCDPSVATFAREQADRFQAKITENEDRSIVITYPSTVEHEIIKWVLGSFGASEIVSPKSLRKKVAEIAAAIAARHAD